MAIKHSLGLKNYNLANGEKGAFDADGRINFYTGSPPTDPDAAATGTLLATLGLAATGFGTPSGGGMAAAAISPDTSVDASGTVGWFRIYKAAESPAGASGVTGAGTTFRRLDGTVTATGGGGDITFDTVAWVAGGQAAMSSLTLNHAV